MIRIIARYIFLMLPMVGGAQIRDTSIFAFPIQIDEVVVRAAREGFDIADFIRRVQQDTTFYKAFRTLHLKEYDADNDINFTDRKGKSIATYQSRTRQFIINKCRSMKVLSEQHTGDFYDRKGAYNYYTATLFAYLFFTNTPVCNETNTVAGTEQFRGKGQLEKHKWQLKQLIFNPGSRVGGVPFAGKKAAVFESDLQARYTFQLTSAVLEGTDCWLFRATPKQGFEKDVIYNDLATWFRKSDFAIVARDYALSYKTIVYDFDVRMKVRLTSVRGELLPASVHYEGNWNVPFKRRERGQFTAKMIYR